MPDGWMSDEGHNNGRMKRHRGDMTTVMVNAARRSRHRHDTGNV